MVLRDAKALYPSVYTRWLTTTKMTVPGHTVLFN
jgi:hypothetical protein